jgi:DNA-binding PadR family transcriptional regulator
MGTILGEFEQLVLLALLRLGEAAYGVTVLEEIERRSGQAVSAGTVYRALLRLESKGLVESWEGEPTAERGGRRKRHYRVLAEGRVVLAQSLAVLGRMAEGLEGTLGLPSAMGGTVGRRHGDR